MTAPAPTTAITFPHLPVLRARLTYRLLQDTTLPPYKGALLRGGFGYAFQRASCARSCWGRAERCDAAILCPYRWVFETPRPDGVPHLHDLQDVPRPFVIEPPLDHKRQYAAGDALEFGLVRMKLGGLIGAAALREVPAALRATAVRAALLAASVLHVGKAAVFGHGLVGVSGL